MAARPRRSPIAPAGSTPPRSGRTPNPKSPAISAPVARELLTALLASTHVGVAVTDANGAVIAANRVFETRYCGRVDGLEGARGRRGSAVDEGRLRRSAVSASADENPFVVTASDGSTVEVTTVVVRTRRRVEALLWRFREISPRSATLDDGAHLGSWQWDDSGHRMHWSPQMWRLYGMSMRNRAPSLDAFVSACQPEDQEKLRARLARTLSSGEPDSGEFRVLVGDVVRTHWISFRRVEDDKAGEVKLAGTNVDITPLRQEVDAAESANRAKTQFLASMSHELRTPLNAVLALSEALSSGAYGELNPKQMHCLDTIYKSGRHLLDLVNDLLDVSRIEAGRLALDIRPVVLSDIIDECVETMREGARAHRQRLVVRHDPGVGRVPVDPRRMRQILLNLIGNAVKFCGENGTTRVSTRLSRDGREVTVTIADSGPGISQEAQSLLFRPFVSIDSAQSREHQGAGLGLALVKGLVELHEGRVHLDSRPGRGARFSIVLPLTGAGGAPARRSSATFHAADASKATARTVLLACGERQQTDAVGALLHQLGYRIHHVRQCQDACERAREGSYRAVLIHIGLPMGSGLACVRELKRRGLAAPVVVFSECLAEGHREICLAAGADEHLAGPVSRGELGSVLGRFSEHAAAIRWPR